MTAAELERLADEIDREVDARVRDGYCGCGERLPVVYQGTGRDRHVVPFEEGRRRFIRESHRQRQYRAKLRRLAKAQGAPVALSLEAVKTTIPASDRIGDAQKPRRKRQSKPRAGLSVYFPTVRDAQRAAEWIDLLGAGPAATPELEGAARALDRALERHARKAAA